MSRSLLLTCNSRSATISVHEYDAARKQVKHLRDVVLPVPAGETHASPMALSPDGTLVYLAWRGSDKRLMTFVLDRSAALTLAQNQPIADDLCFLNVAADGACLLGAGGDSITDFTLDVHGLPTSAGSPRQVGAMAHCVVTDKQGQIHATACRGDALRSFYDDGRVVDIAQPQGSGPRHLCLSPDGRHLYLVTQESGEVVSFSIDGGLCERQRLTMVDEADAPMGGDIGITPDGRFVYATERSSNRVVGFAVEHNGTLRRIGMADVPDYPRALCIGGSGKFLVVAGFRGHSAAIFDIGKDGALIPTTAFATGERPSWVLAVDGL